MSITFRTDTDADDRVGPVATINARQLAAFRTFLSEEGVRISSFCSIPTRPKTTASPTISRRGSAR